MDSAVRHFSPFHDHHIIKDPVICSSRRRAHAPAIHVVAEGNEFSKVKEFCLDLHSFFGHRHQCLCGAKVSRRAQRPQTSSTKGASPKKARPRARKQPRAAKPRRRKAPRQVKAAKPARAKEASTPRAESKGAKILELIGRTKGATLAE